MKFKTKRFLYDVFKKNVLNKNGCTALVGPKGVGKTVLMMQLAEETASVYKDVGTLDSTFSFDNFFEDCKKNNIKNIFLDDVCKLKWEHIGDFFTCTRKYSECMCIVIAGSVSGVVSKMCDKAVCNNEYVLPPILYIERLCWGLNQETIDKDFIKNHSTYENFIEYIKEQNIKSNKEQDEYINGALSDLENILDGGAARDTAIELFCIPMSLQEIKDVINYMSLCQFVYEIADKELVIDLPLTKLEKENLKKEYFKIKQKIEPIKLDSVICSMYGSTLAHSVFDYKGENLSVQDINLTDTRYYIFEYPWLAGICLSKYFTGQERYINMCVKYLVLLRGGYIYNYLNKYYSTVNDAVNTRYTTVDMVPFICFGRDKNISGHYKIEYENIEKQNGLKYVKASRIDGDEKTVYLRVDKVIASMELEYMELLLKEGIYSNDSVDVLVEKYFG